MKKIVLVVFVIVFITSSIVMLSEKIKTNKVDKDIKNYSQKIDDLNKQISEFDTKKEQVKEEVLNKIDEDKLEIYKVWEIENNYLDEALR